LDARSNRGPLANAVEDGQHRDFGKTSQKALYQGHIHSLEHGDWRGGEHADRFLPNPRMIPMIAIERA
jgi:hypothetical protein